MIVWIIIQEIFTPLSSHVWNIFSLPISVGLGHVMCFGQWDISGCDTSKGLACACVIGLAILHL